MDNKENNENAHETHADPRSRWWSALGLLISGATGVGVGYLIAKPKAKPPCACKVNGNGGNGNGNGNGG